MPFALVAGEPLTVIPKDLYIPPDALEVILEAFEGPLDLLLYLIKKQNLDILDIPIKDITVQYVQYIEMMQIMRIEIAAEYLLMAAMLAEIKSRMLLPRPTEEEDEDDPRAELVRRLQEYERFKKAAHDIDELPRMDRDTFRPSAELPEIHQERPQPEIDLRELLMAFKDAMSRAEMYEEGRRGVVVTLLAILELVKEQLIDMVQSEPFSPIHIKAAGGSQAGSPKED
jgi:segregation and condensation protein A